MYFFVREHVIPVGYEDTVMAWYEDGILEGMVPSPFIIDYKIRKRWKREDVWEEHSFLLEVSEEQMLFAAIESASMDQFWKDQKPEGKYEVHGEMVCSNEVCGICLCSSGSKLQLECECMFHKSCIEEWARYKKTCPKCFLPINTTNRVSIPCNENESEENPH